ncbi:hypothetical protein V6N13_093880 [Hibiscus sabdariffa]
MEASSSYAEAFSLYVENILKAMHWKGLGHVFARYGDVVDVFIARKLSRIGKLFGFVRFEKQEDANKAIERLNGFVLYGAKLSVSMAKYTGGRPKWIQKIQGHNGKGEEEISRKLSLVRITGKSAEGSIGSTKKAANQQHRKI